MECGAGMETRAKQKKAPGRQEKTGEEIGEIEPTARRHDNAEGEISLEKILVELREFRKENNEKLADIKEDLNTTNKRIEEAEGRIAEAEEQIQQTGEVVSELLKLQAQLEAKLTDQEGRSRRDNIRIYGIPEGSENGSSTIKFIEELLKNELGLDPTMDLNIQRAHRALAPKPTDSARPRSIIAKFLSFKTKEEILGQVWKKGGLKWNNARISCDHDYPPEVLKKRKEYAQAKAVLKEKKIRFQTPYPAKLRVFYEGETVLYNSAEEATKDMKDRGLQVGVIRPQQTPLERLQRRAWTTKRGRGSQVETNTTPDYVERLKTFRRK